MYDQKILNGAFQGKSLITIFPDKEKRNILRLSRLNKNLIDIIINIYIIKMQHN